MEYSRVSRGERTCGPWCLWSQEVAVILYVSFQVFDGPSITSHLLAKLCGSKKPAPLRSSGDSMYIKLRTDEDQQGGGFLANYRQSE